MTQRIQLPDDRVAIEGAVGTDVSPTGFTARRLNDAYRHQFPMEVEFLSSSPSGVRLRFVTDSASIGLEVLATHFQVGDEALGVWSRFDLVVDNEARAHQETKTGHLLVIDRVTGKFDFRPGEPSTVLFDHPAPGTAVEIWLPNASIVEVRARSRSTTARRSPPHPWTPDRSGCTTARRSATASRPQGPAFTWPATAARLADVNLTNLGLAGQCHLDQFTARTIRDLPADLISLKCGINVVNGDTLRLRTFAPALHGFLDTVRDGHPDTPLLVVSPILCPPHEEHAGPSDGTSGVTVALGTTVTEKQGALTLQQIRGIIEQVVAARVDAGDANLHYLDGRVLFDEGDLDHLPDALHPNGDGYIRMGERFAERIFGSGGAFSR